MIYVISLLVHTEITNQGTDLIFSLSLICNLQFYDLWSFEIHGIKYSVYIAKYQ